MLTTSPFFLLVPLQESFSKDFFAFIKKEYKDCQ